MRIKVKTYAANLARNYVQSSKIEFIRKAKNKNELFLRICDNSPCVICFNYFGERFTIEFLEKRNQAIYSFHGVKEDNQIILYRNIVKRVPDLFVGGCEMMEILQNISPADAQKFREHLNKSNKKLLGMENQMFVQELKSFDKELLFQFKNKTVELYFQQIQKLVGQIIEKLIKQHFR